VKQQGLLKNCIRFFHTLIPFAETAIGVLCATVVMFRPEYKIYQKLFHLQWFKKIAILISCYDALADEYKAGSSSSIGSVCIESLTSVLSIAVVAPLL
jgi:hypothetical protein